MMNNKKYKVVSLFSGCGGMDLGFEGGFTFLNKEYKENPFKIIYSNDFEKKACETYRLCKQTERKTRMVGHT